MSEIKIDVTEANDMIYNLDIGVNSLYVPIVYTDISSNSVAMDEFITAYYDFRTMLLSYTDFLYHDIERILKAVSELETADSQSAGQVESITSGVKKLP